MKPAELATPAALVDEAVMDRNIAAMQARMRQLGVRFRPHVKTAKCVDIARRQLQAGAQGITVSTLTEASAFFAAGFHDILYAVCIAPAKLARARRLCEAGCRLTILVDSVDAAQAVVDAGYPFEVMIEIDTDGDRAGVRADDPALLRIGRLLRDGGAILRGVLAHAGSTYACRSLAAVAAVAELERTEAVRAAAALRAAGLPCDEVSVGSTPSACAAVQLDGVTEVRAGAYVFQDLVMANIGAASIDQLALSVLATVIGHQPQRGWVLIDAGWTALSRDRGTQTQQHDYGYGAVCDAAGVHLPGWVVHEVNQEHGIVACADPDDATDIVARFPFGSQLRILPNHACATAAQFSAYKLLGTDGAVTELQRISGW